MTPFGAEIRRLRSTLAMTLKRHAAKIGVTPAYLSALEHGHRGLPTDDMVRRIVGGLEVAPSEQRSLRELLKLSRPKMTIDTAGLDPMATEIANRLALSIPQMGRNELKELLWFLRGRETGEPLNGEVVDQDYDSRARKAE